MVVVIRIPLIYSYRDDDIQQSVRARQRSQCKYWKIIPHKRPGNLRIEIRILC